METSEKIQGKELTAILQTRVDSKRNIWLCARDRFNSGSPVYVSGVPSNLQPGTVIIAVVADDKGTCFFSREV
jgi:hypothetical protein